MQQHKDRTQLNAEVLKQFRLIFQSVRKHFQDVEASCGISGAQLWALAQVVEQPDIRVTELARALSIHQSTASNLVEDMVQRNLITRVKGQTDQRVVQLRATDAGLEIFDRAPKPLKGLLPEAIDHFPLEALDHLNVLLGQVIAQMGDRAITSGKDIPLSEITRAPLEASTRQPRRRSP